VSKLLPGKKFLRHPLTRKRHVMNQFVLTSRVLILSAALAFAGCVPSEETGSGLRAKSPVQVFGPIDTTHRAVHHGVSQDTVSKLKMDSATIAQAKKPRIAPKFRSRQDTVRASLVKKSKSPSRPLIIIVRPEHPFYTVQVGAFGHVSNALRAQKKAKDYFPNQPVFSNFINHAKLYRVSIGRYENRTDAFALSDSLQQQYPREYKRCWINFIP